MLNQNVRLLCICVNQATSEVRARRFRATRIPPGSTGGIAERHWGSVALVLRAPAEAEIDADEHDMEGDGDDADERAARAQNRGNRFDSRAEQPQHAAPGRSQP